MEAEVFLTTGPEAAPVPAGDTNVEEVVVEPLGFTTPPMM
jgi:hypothetical protein